MSNTMLAMPAVALLLLCITPTSVPTWSLWGEGSSQPSASNEGVPRYEPDRQYSYIFDSQMASSLTTGKQFSVARIRVGVKMQFLLLASDNGDRMAVVQCEQVQLAMAQQHLNITPTQHQRMLDFDDLETMEVSAKIQQTIQLPFQVKLSKSGRVEEILFQQDDQTWSENIKRSIVNLIQVQADRDNSKQKGGNYNQTDASPPSQDTLVYSQMESTIEGRCQAFYTIMHHQQRPESDERRHQGSLEERLEEQQSDSLEEQLEEQQPGNAQSKSVTVVKAIDFGKCSRRPELRYNFLRHAEDFSVSNAFQAGQQPHEKEAVEVSTVYEIQVGQPSSEHVSSSTQGNDNDAQPNPVVLRSQVMSQISANLMDSVRPAMITYTTAQIVLTSVLDKPSNEEWTSLANAKPAANLQAEFSPLVYSLAADRLHERFITQGDEQYLKPETIAYPPTDSLPTIAVSIMKKLLEAAKVSGKSKFLDIGEEATHQLERFINVMRLCTKQQLGSIRQQLRTLITSANHEVSWKTSKFLKDIFIDSLTLACTQPSIAEFAELIGSKEVNNSKAARAISQLAQCRVVGPTQLDQVWELCESAAAKTYHSFRRSCLLTWGTMAGAMCPASEALNASSIFFAYRRQLKYGSQPENFTAVEEEKATLHPLDGHSDSDKWASYVMDKGENHPHTGRQCTPAMGNELVAKLRSVYDSASGDQQEAEKIAAIKALGNAGLPASLVFLQKLAKSSSESQLLRVQAIDAMRHIVHLAPKAVKHAMLPLFQDREQPEVVRLNAFNLLLHSQPSSAEMDIVCSTMQQESNQHVKAFVQAAIREMAESRQHFDQKTAKNLQLALAKLKARNVYDESVEHRSKSQLHQYTFFSGPFTYTESSRENGSMEFGVGVTTTKIYGKDSATLPKEFTVALDVLFDGRLTNDVVQVSFHQQNAEKALQHISDYISNKNFDQVVVRTKRSTDSDQPNTYNPYELLKRFLAKHIHFGGFSSATADPNQKPQLLVSARMHGKDVDFVLMDEKYVLDNFVHNGRFDISALESTNDQQFHHYSASLGRGFKVKVPSVAGIPIIVTMSVPTLVACEGSAKLEMEPFGSDKLRGMRFSVNMQAQAAQTLINTMEVFSPLFTSGVNTHHSAVLKFPLNVQLKLESFMVEGSSSPSIPTVELTWRMPRKDMRLKHISSRPTIFQRVWPTSGTMDKFIARREQTLYVPGSGEASPKHRKRFTCLLSGMVIESRSHWSARNPHCANAIAHSIIGGENSYELWVLPTKSQLIAGKVRAKLQFQQINGDGGMNKEKLLGLFDNASELFNGSAPQEVQLVRHFIQSYHPRMNIITKTRLTVDAEQSPQQRSGCIELTTICDQHKKFCQASCKAEWKRKGYTGEGASSQNSTALSTTCSKQQSEPYELKMNASAQLASSSFKGVYLGGVLSQHMLGKLEVQFTGTCFNYTTDGEEQGKFAASIYAKPSEYRVTDWQTVMEETQQQGIFSGTPKVLKANDARAVLEFQSTMPSNEMLRQGYTKAKSLLPHSHFNIQKRLEDQLWSSNNEQQHKVKFYMRFIVDDITYQGQPTKLYNFSISDDPKSLLETGSMKKLEEENGPKKGNHLRVNTHQQWFDEEANKRTLKKKLQRARQAHLGRQSSFSDLFSPSDVSSSEDYAECSIDGGRYVRSFDGQNYVIPLLKSCYTVVAKDCSEQQRGNQERQLAFTVLAKKEHHQGPRTKGKQQERMHVMMKLEGPQRRQYELYLAAPNSQHHHPEPFPPLMIIKRNGEELSEEDYEQEGITVINPNAPEAAPSYRDSGNSSSISRLQQSLPIYIIHCPVTGAEVIFNGWQLRVRIAPRYANRQCGMCGFYNMDSTDELTIGSRMGGRGNKLVTTSLLDFHLNYVESHDETCDEDAFINLIPWKCDKIGQQQNKSGNGYFHDAYTFSKGGNGNHQFGWGPQMEAVSHLKPFFDWEAASDEVLTCIVEEFMKLYGPSELNEEPPSSPTYVRPSLPQYASPEEKLKRNKEVSEMQAVYMFDYQTNIPSVPMLKVGEDGLPQAEKPSRWWKIKIFCAYLRAHGGTGISLVIKMIKHPSKIVEFLKLAFSILGTYNLRPEQLEDYDALFTHLPASAAEFNDDAAFCRWRLAGPNPVTIKVCTEELLTTKANLASLPKDVQDEVWKAHAESRLYVVDYTELGLLNNSWYGKLPKYSPGPLALFAVPTDHATRHRQWLEVLAIQCEHMDSSTAPGHLPPMFHPKDGIQWQMAKAVFNSADGNYHEAVVHLGQTHLVLEPFMVATKRTLPACHPIHILLHRHFEGTGFINHLADTSLINPGGAVDQLTSPDIINLNKYMAMQVRDTLSGDFGFPALLKRRGMDSFPATYPYRDDGMLVWNATKEFVEGYLSLPQHYGVGAQAKDAIKNDYELQAWIDELKTHGAVKWLKDFDGSPEQLAHLLAAVMFTASAQHAAVNYPQRDLEAYVPAFPLALYGLPPASRHDNTIFADYLNMLPPLEMAKLQKILAYILGGVFYTKLGDYGDDYFILEVLPLLKKYQRALRNADKEDDRRNDEREAAWHHLQPNIAKNWRYTYMQPKNIPISINI